MRKVDFCFITIVLIFIFGSIILAQELPSLTESSPPAPSPTPPATNIAPPLPPPVPETSSNAINTFSYTDPTCSFTFNLLPNWVPNEQVGGADKKLKAEVDLFSGEYLVASFYVYVDNTDLSLSQYAIEEEEWMVDPQNLSEYNKISEEAINLGALPAIKRVYTYNYINQENSKFPLEAIDIYLVKDNRAYMLVGEVDKSLFDKILPDLETMFNSFIISEITTAASSTGDETAFKFCPYCGGPLQSDYQFCPGCGKPITNQRTIKAPKKEGVRSDKKTRINYPVNLTQTRGFLKELNQSDYSRGMNKNYSKPFNSFKPAFISRSFGSQLVRIFPEKPLLPWAVSRRIISDYYDYGKLLPDSIGRKISSQMLTTRSSYPENLSFSYLEGLGKQIAFNPNLGTTFRGGAINQLGSSLKNLGEGITSLMTVSRAPLSGKNWVLRGAKGGVQENISLGSFIGRISSKIGSLIIDQIRYSPSLGACFSNFGQGISSEVGVKREAETLPPLAPISPQTTPILPTLPPSTGPEGIVSPTPGVPAQGGITLTPPGQPAPAPPGLGGIVLPSPGTPQEPQIIWKQYSLNQAFGHNPLIAGYLEYPSTWLVNLDSFNRNVTFSEDASGLTSLTLFPGLMGQFNSAQDLAQQMTYLLQQQVPDLSILNQEFKIVPTPGSGAIEVTEGKINLQGSYQGTTFGFDIETYVIYTGVYGPASGMGYVILTQAPQNIFIEKEQKYFNRMILSYKRALGVVK